MSAPAPIKKRIRYCRLNKFTAVYLVEKHMLLPHAQIMGKDIVSIGLWTELTETNVESIKMDRTVTDFILRKRSDEEVEIEDVFFLNRS